MKGTQKGSSTPSSQWWVYECQVSNFAALYICFRLSLHFAPCSLPVFLEKERKEKKKKKSTVSILPPSSLNCSSWLASHIEFIIMLQLFLSYCSFINTSSIHASITLLLSVHLSIQFPLWGSSAAAVTTRFS